MWHTFGILWTLNLCPHLHVAVPNVRMIKFINVVIIRVLNVSTRLRSAFISFL